VKNKRAKETRVLFIEPHGLHHAGLPGNEDKIEVLKELGKLSDDEPFRRKKVTLDGYVLTDTPLPTMSAKPSRTSSPPSTRSAVRYRGGVQRGAVI